jgi:hypothetical protein
MIHERQTWKDLKGSGIGQISKFGWKECGNPQKLEP